jgi:hypothetical protein
VPGKVMTRSEPPPTKAEIDHGVPVFLDQLVSAPPRTDQADIGEAVYGTTAESGLYRLSSARW